MNAEECLKKTALFHQLKRALRRDKSYFIECISELMEDFHAQQSKGMYTEEEVKEITMQARADGRAVATKGYGENDYEYWESIKPKNRSLTVRSTKPKDMSKEL